MSKRIWQPMSKAPKDGTWIAAYASALQAPITVRFQFMRGLKGGAWVDTSNSSVPTELLEAFYPLPGFLQEEVSEDFADHPAYAHFVRMLKASEELHAEKLSEVESAHEDEMSMARERLAWLPIYSDGALVMKTQIEDLEREVARLKALPPPPAGG